MAHEPPFSGEDLRLLTDHPERNLRQILEHFYSSVPATQCLSCGECCQLTQAERRKGWVTMFPLYAVEYLYVVDYIREYLPEAEQGYYFGFTEEWPLQCPFRDLKGGGCRIYPVRPFTCRAYGVLNQELVEKAAHRHDGEVPSEWLRLFRTYEEHLRCPNVQVTEPHKLDNYMAGRVSFRYSRALEWLSWKIDLLDAEKRRALSEVTGRDRIIRWTWGGFNALYFSPDEGFEDHLRSYWPGVKLVL